MKKSRVGKRILAWMLVFAMFWQSAGVETLAASITASDGVETLTEERASKQRRQILFQVGKQIRYWKQVLLQNDCKKIG